VEWQKEKDASYSVNITVPEKSTAKIILKEKVNVTVGGGQYSYKI
jgi:hypothetical protein